MNSRRDNLIVTILVLSLLFNYYTYRQVVEMRSSLSNFASRNDVQNVISNTTAGLRSELQQMAEEGRWVRQSSFTLNKAASTLDGMVVRGEWTFSELAAGQVPVLLWREKDGADWHRSELKSNGGLTYSGELSLQPDKGYEYQVAAKGAVTRAGDIQPVPFETYGWPRWNLELGHSSQGQSGKQIISFNLFFQSPPPIEEMELDRAYLEVTKDGLTERIPFQSDNRDSFKMVGTTNWEIGPDEPIEYLVAIVGEFKNGVVRREEFDALSAPFGWIKPGESGTEREVSTVIPYQTEKKLP